MNIEKDKKADVNIIKLLQNLISVYTFQPFVTKDMEEWVKHVWKLKNKRIHNNMIYAGNVSFQTAKKSLLYRYPVYYGYLLFEKIDIYRFASLYPPSKESEKNGHINSVINKVMRVNPFHRYVWGGPVYVRTKSGKSIRTKRNQTTYVLHTWGVNLETPLTDDYKQFIDAEKYLRREAYASVTLKMLENIAKSIEIIMNGIKKTRKKDQVHLVMPQIGAGAFLSALYYRSDYKFASTFLFNAVTYTPNQKSIRDNSFILSRSVTRTLNRISRLFEKNNVHIHYCIYDGKTVNHAQNVVSNVSNLVTVHYGNGIHTFGKNEGDIFYVLRKLNNSKHLILVNAWDSKSFVGNGMSIDPTIDGFIVSGTKNGSHWQNTSFLHNPILHIRM